MGEVYRAVDTRLHRTVAIKVLSAHFSTDPQRRLRFVREAQTISSLNHPNICSLFDVGLEGGTEFLVMEDLTGETLSARLARGPLPLDQVFRIAIEIGDALETAHRNGVIHRDLKPGNIMISDARAKLLDFGLAKPALANASERSRIPPTRCAAIRLRWKGPLLERRHTWRRNNSKDGRPTPHPTCSRLGQCCSRC